MTAHQLNVKLNDPGSELKEVEDEFSTPLDISDIIAICQEYNKLGWQIQTQTQYIIENGVEESIKTGIVAKKSLPLIKNFLRQISNNVYFGDAIAQAQECIDLIDLFLEKNTNNLTMN